MSDTYCTDDDILNEDAHARRLLTDRDGGKTSGTFNRHRLKTKDRIDKALARREPPITASVGNPELVECEVLGVLSMGYLEQASAGGEVDLYMAKAKAFEARFLQELASIRVGDDGDEDPGSIGESIPIFRS
jgi:hypothetical protein